MNSFEENDLHLQPNSSKLMWMMLQFVLQVESVFYLNQYSLQNQLPLLQNQLLYSKLLNLHIQISHFFSFELSTFSLRL